MPGRDNNHKEDQPPKWWVPVLAVLLVASIILAGVALMVQVADFDVDTRVGIVDFELDTDWKVGSVTYSGSASEFGVEVEDEQVLMQGTGDFQEAVGFLKGTAKRVTNSITPFTNDPLGKRATLNVSAETDTIPWWVVGVSTPCRVEVVLIEYTNVSSLKVDRVYLEFRREIDGEIQKKEVWSKDVDDTLSQVGDKLTYKADLVVNEDWGEFQIFGMVDVTMVDADGITANQVKRSYYNEPKVITIWTIPTGDGIKIALLIAALPVYVIGMIFVMGGVLAIVLKKKGRMVLPIVGGILLFLGALFFMLGVSQLAELVGYPDDLSFTFGFWLMLLGFVPAVVVGGLAAYEKSKYGKEEGEKEGKEEGKEEASDRKEVASSAAKPNTVENTIKEEERE